MLMRVCASLCLFCDVESCVCFCLDARVFCYCDVASCCEVVLRGG